MLCGLYARGGPLWPLGFVALVPWLGGLSRERTLAGTLLSAWAMSAAFTAAVFAWFGAAIGSYAQLGTAGGIALLLLAAPLFQPQIVTFALIRHATLQRYGSATAAIAGALAWVAAEWAVPRLLGDTFGHGLQPSLFVRQAADLGGATGLTLALLLANEAVAAALARRRQGLRGAAVPLGLAALVPALLAGYGAARLATLTADAAPAAKPLRVGLVQSNISDYERLRREKGAGAVVREVLDTHYAMSYELVERQRVDAVLWSETVYPTTFGRPKSAAGAELDREILEIVDAARVPFVFGTYDGDAAGEYNAAAFVAPGAGRLGAYRKTRLFPLTEYVPAWLDGPALRAWLPWAGSWRPGDGARVFPLRLADGREIPVQPLICLDDVDADLAIAGARLGAQALVTMSNDAWFSEQGAALHQAAAIFRSVETRLPQFRVTTNGFSAVIDATGTVIAGTRRGEPMLAVGDVAVREVAPTLMVAWGDWLGRAAAALLALLGAAALLARWAPRHAPVSARRDATVLARVAVLPQGARSAAGALRAFARASLLGIVAAIALGDGPLQTNTFAQLRLFAALFLVPEIAAWCVLRAFAARAAVEDDALVFARGARRLALPLGDIAAVEPWRLPLPGSGAALRLASGARWHLGIAVADPQALARALGIDRAGADVGTAPAASSMLRHAQARQAVRRGRLDAPLAKFVLLPLLLALPAFRLHQHIAYGSSLGEYYSFGLAAFLRGFSLWWAAWAVGVVLCAAVLRTAIEAGTLAGALLRPAAAVNQRLWLERLGLAALYLGLPAWLAARLLGG